jgi:hypothetical protein
VLRWGYAATEAWELTMSRLSIADKTFLEGVLAMSGGYVFDFTDGSFANFLADINIDIYDSEKYSGFGGSKANRLRALWKKPCSP